ncbi:hypothetical protein [Dyella psychrodurans]|uniref:hypothetical protein n=1 Tax=Dyella psychrodurans TaxID=1927960 RepID=UPI0011C06D1B|nr:hypothetical protein [Dyella psychrodurans]
MNNQIKKLIPNARITCVETDLKSLLSTQIHDPENEISRHGPYLIRVDIKFQSPSEHRLVNFLQHLVSSIHNQACESYDIRLGFFQGHLIVQDPARDGTFPTGTYLIQLWVKDHPIFYSDEHRENAQVAASMFESCIENAFYDLNQGSSLWHEGIGLHVQTFEKTNSWLSYQVEAAALGTQIGMHACFVGPDLFQVCSMEPLLISPISEASISPSR